MVRILHEKNPFLFFTKQFFSFIWKLEKAVMNPDNVIKSPKFNLTGEKESFFEVKIRSTDHVVFLYLRNSNIVNYPYFVIIISDAENAVIHSQVQSNFKIQDDTDLLYEFGRIPPGVKYPITMTCIAKDLEVLTNKSSSSSLYSVHLNSLKELSSDFKKAMDLNMHCDFALNVKGETIRAHKMVLGARSPVFDKMFSNDSLEAAENEVAISDIGAETMRKLLNYLYTGTVEKYSFEENLELYYAADKYEVLSLRDICKTQLLNLLAVDNACSLFALAVRHSDEDLKEQVARYVSNNFKPVVDSESFAQLSRDDMTLLMRLCASDRNSQISK